ncbi:MAG: 2-C-methyl-D-erythritol 4-phosphate cytidylyltransferase [Coriobacteriia bacterium]|nr:2-C-methyl-D-erythritol 4-phosphate cytidylyltransferase [Coriobacteriia bacterium]
MADAFDMDLDTPVNLFDRLKKNQPENFSMKKIPGVVDDKADVAAIVLAGGTGSRIAADLRDYTNKPKQLIKMSGKPVLTWSMDSFDAVGQIGCIVVVCPEEDFEQYINEVVDPFAFQTPVLMAPSGESRQESAFSGLDFVTDQFKYVLIHDGARPLVPPSIIKHIINVLKGCPECDGAVCAHPAIDTLKVVEDEMIVGTPDRSAFWEAQTPQVFKTKVYREAHLAALADGFVGSDGSSLVERIGGSVKVVEGKRNNIKLTVPEDYLILASVLHSLKLEHGSEFDL